MMDMAILLHDGLCWTSRLVGVCAFSGSLRDFKLALSKRPHLVPPTSG